MPAVCEPQQAQEEVIDLLGVGSYEAAGRLRARPETGKAFLSRGALTVPQASNFV